MKNSNPTIADVIAHDLAMKCGNDVADVIQRTMRLCDSKGACLCVTVAGAGMAFSQVAGALFAGQGPITGETLDKVWRDLIRPIAMLTIDRSDFDTMLADVAAKPDRINGEQG